MVVVAIVSSTGGSIGAGSGVGGASHAGWHCPTARGAASSNPDVVSRPAASAATGRFGGGLVTQPIVAGPAVASASDIHGLWRSLVSAVPTPGVRKVGGSNPLSPTRKIQVIGSRADDQTDRSVRWGPARKDQRARFPTRVGSNTHQQRYRLQQRVPRLNRRNGGRRPRDCLASAICGVLADVIDCVHTGRRHSAEAVDVLVPLVRWMVNRHPLDADRQAA